MKKRNKTQDWYRLDEILKYPASYYMIIGERSNGKTYSVKERILDKYESKGEKFVYMRRLHRHITRRKMKKVFNDINDKFEDRIGSRISYDTENDFTIMKDGIKETIGACVSVQDAIDLKGLNYNEITTIIFDEFLDLNYLDDEIERFLNVISTIVRERENVEIFMLGNTISKFCPYFDLFGIDPRKIKQGTFAHYTHKLGVTCTLEWCKSKVKDINKEKTSKYLGFDGNRTVEMILYGEWEYKEVNLKNIDGIGWSTNRVLIPAYVTALGNVFELTLYNKKDMILFVRKLNTQNGEVRKGIKYNICFDNSIKLTNKNGAVPIYSKMSEKLMTNDVFTLMTYARECLRVNRVVYDKTETGTEFEIAFKNIW